MMEVSCEVRGAKSVAIRFCWIGLCNSNSAMPVFQSHLCSLLFVPVRPFELARSITSIA